MSKAKKESFFWTSYSDLMTSLFFVMLVLFVLVIMLLHNKMKELQEVINTTQELVKTTQEQLDKIREIEASVQHIDSRYFEYNPQFKRHTLNDIRISFHTGSSNIMDLSSDQLDELKNVGHAIQRFVADASKTYPNVKYLLIIEGQTSRDNYSRNFELSFERALALHRYWRENCGIIFDNDKCETIISGSGQESDFREIPDDANNINNQRFVIHIIPKTGSWEM